MGYAVTVSWWDEERHEGLYPLHRRMAFSTIHEAMEYGRLWVYLNDPFVLKTKQLALEWAHAKVSWRYGKRKCEIENTGA